MPKFSNVFDEYRFGRLILQIRDLYTKKIIDFAMI